MAITTWTELKSAVADWLHRSDLTTPIPDFIALGEHRLARDLRLPALLSRDNVTVSAGAATGTLPTGFVEAVAARLSGSNELRFVTQDVYDRMLVNANSVTTPLYFTVIGSSLYVAPAWTAGGTVVLTSFKKETALSGSTASNWYLANAPDALLYASLIEAAAYLHDDAAVGKWRGYYENARDRVNETYGAVDAGLRGKQLTAGAGKALAPSV